MDDISKAAAQLAKTAVAARAVRRQRVKQAHVDWQAVLQWAKENPQLAGPIIGSVLGAGTGLATSFAQPREDRRSLRSALTGGLAGGLLGFGGGLAYSQGDKIKQLFDPESEIGQEIKRLNQAKNQATYQQDLAQHEDTAQAVRRGLLYPAAGVTGAAVAGDAASRLYAAGPTGRAIRPRAEHIRLGAEAMGAPPPATAELLKHTDDPATMRDIFNQAKRSPQGQVSLPGGSSISAEQTRRYARQGLTQSNLGKTFGGWKGLTGRGLALAAPWLGYMAYDYYRPQQPVFGTPQ